MISMEKEWQPSPLHIPIPELPNEKPKPKDLDEPSKKPDMGDSHESPTPSRGSIIIGGDEVDPREWDPFKKEDEL